jgi:type IV pilus assembly protein PilQ
MFVPVTFAAFLAATSAVEAARPATDTDLRISIDLKQVDIVDVVRMLSEVGGFQVVLDPGISCQPTLKLSDVPWPTVLDVALRTCRLAYEEDNGIIRVAPAARLMQEHNERRKLAEEQKLNRPLTMTRYRLSYARAEQLAPIIKKFLSPRGEVVIDPRTNTLIIIDIE